MDISLRRREIASVAAILALLLCACGGITRLAGLAITVAPATASVKAGTTLEIAGTAEGFNETEPVIFWAMSVPNSTLADWHAPNCGVADNNAPPRWSDCPCGYVAYKSDTGRHGTGTYYAPSTVPSSKCYPTFSAVQISPFYAKSGSAEITVVP